MLYELIFPIGLMMTGQVGTILVPLLGWKSLFLLGGLPGLVVAYLLYHLPESPRWLIAKGRYEEARGLLPAQRQVPRARVISQNRFRNRSWHSPNFVGIA